MSARQSAASTDAWKATLALHWWRALAFSDVAPGPKLAGAILAGVAGVRATGSFPNATVSMEALAAHAGCSGPEMRAALDTLYRRGYLTWRRGAREATEVGQAPWKLITPGHADVFGFEGAHAPRVPGS